MASETEYSEQSSPFMETLINSSNRDISLFIPVILGLTAAGPPQETQDQAAPRESRDRIILVNPFTQSMVVLESNSGSLGLGLDSLFGDFFSGKNGQRPASRTSIDAMPSVEIVKGSENGDEQCVVCLEEWEGGEMAKEMPCKHRFHGECIEKWLRICGSCPVCRYEMPVDEDDDLGKKCRGENEGEGRRREIWVSFGFGGLRNGENNQTSSDHQETEA
ncbi:hypothetical protein DH2020_032574 [Rehmannia glutinosa]|uniref:RING-type E3 ubiquitin transferase n=1 Tax=Rehmannia glutinosa TaxID=99300 RepID=A0ABR0VHV4_REHGL